MAIVDEVGSDLEGTQPSSSGTNGPGASSADPKETAGAKTEEGHEDNSRSVP